MDQPHRDKDLTLLDQLHLPTQQLVGQRPFRDFFAILVNEAALAPLPASNIPLWTRHLPDSVWVGPRLALDARVRPPQMAPGVSMDAVTANLSGLGGPKLLDLRKIGNQTYKLDCDLAVGPVGNGYRKIAVNFRAGRFASSLSKAVAVLPNKDLEIFKRQLNKKWQLESI